MNDETQRATHPFRRRDSNWPKEYIELLLEKLADLQQQTDPAGGTETSAAKDLHAFRALQTAGKLVHAVAGWAIDHQYGLALNGLEFVPLQPSGTIDHPEYLEQRAKVDNHQHERDGAIAVRSATINPSIARKALLNLVRANPGAFPSPLRVLTLEALRALDSGEMTPLFEPTGGKYSKIEYREFRLQLQALAFVQYRQVLGNRKYKAREIVATAFGVEPETLRTWEKRLRDKFGHLEVERELAFARNIALSVKALKLAQLKGKGEPVVGASLTEDIEMFEMDYGDEALANAANRYKRLRGFSCS